MKLVSTSLLALLLAVSTTATKPEVDGPYVWSPSLAFPAQFTQPNTAPLTFPFAQFTPNQNITLTRLEALTLGVSYVDPGNNQRGPCAHPAIVYLLESVDRGPAYASVTLAANRPTNSYPPDSGKISVTFQAGQPIIASYQVGEDTAGVCETDIQTFFDRPIDLSAQYTSQ